MEHLRAVVRVIWLWSLLVRWLHFAKLDLLGELWGRLEFSKSVLNVFAKLVLKEHLLELLMLTQFDHRFEVGHVFTALTGEHAVGIVGKLAALVSLVHRHRLIELVDALIVVLWSQGLLHKPDLEERNLVWLDVALLPKAQNLVLDVVDVLIVGCMNVVLKYTLHNLLLALR